MEITTLDDIAEELSGVRHILKTRSKAVYIFGSITSGSAVKGESDIDILVLPKDDIRSEEIYGLLDKQIDRLLDKGLVPHIIIYDQKRHRHLLEKVEKKRVRLV